MDTVKNCKCCIYLLAGGPIVAETAGGARFPPIHRPVLSGPGLSCQSCVTPKLSKTTANLDPDHLSLPPAGWLQCSSFTPPFPPCQQMGHGSNYKVTKFVFSHLKYGSGWMHNTGHAPVLQKRLLLKSLRHDWLLLTRSSAASRSVQSGLDEVLCCLLLDRCQVVTWHHGHRVFSFQSKIKESTVTSVCRGRRQTNVSANW